MTITTCDWCDERTETTYRWTQTDKHGSKHHIDVCNLCHRSFLFEAEYDAWAREQVKGKRR